MYTIHHSYGSKHEIIKEEKNGKLIKIAQNLEIWEAAYLKRKLEK